MAANDLSAPLGLGKRKLLSLPLGLVGAGLIAIIVTTALVWIGVVDDPLGGEPTAVVRLERTVEGLSARDIGVANVGAEGDTIEGGEDADGKKAADEATLGPRFEPAPQEQARSQQTADAPASSPVTLSIRPDARVQEEGPFGSLPKVADNGLRPLDIYARPVDTTFPNIPRIAIIVTGLGLSQSGTQSAIAKLPSEMTLAFAPYGGSLDRWMQQARRKGHELLLQVPLEPFDYPDNDPGPHTLLVTLTGQETAKRIDWLLGRMTNYVGVINYMGARFTATREPLERFLKEVTRRGLMYVDDGSSSRSLANEVASGARTPYSRVDVVIDEVPRAADITSRLLQLEGIARAQGIAVGSASALPVTVDELVKWSRDLEERGLQLVPVSGSIDRSVR
ncbi:divergent polysaccharide deacetylase family protein [Stappia sp. F7233]|uniref:Divergent polysaccharide deacetylase family protein n=1 Tax=Stappia albiluteola TaxID=2758565 RepID=A0A839ABI3_9HYPH|nr:divergent polysaccharide deacetylase family protein [Stappia albiluteola]MBA5777040.1 divergent polysaccharide deacetylase family protein [Stappia albiluteola]